MRWVMFILFVGLLLTLQSAVAPRLALFGLRPDWLLVAVVFFALHARVGDAVLGAWLIGAGADLMSLERLGLMALTYGLAAVLVLSIREYLFRERGRTQFGLTLLVCLLVQLGWLVYRRMAYDPALSVLSDLVFHSVAASVYTAVWAPLFHWAVLQRPGWLGVPRPRYTYAGIHHVGG
jgi:rod shape-determining protein MreD